MQFLGVPTKTTTTTITDLHSVRLKYAGIPKKKKTTTTREKMTVSKFNLHLKINLFRLARFIHLHLHWKRGIRRAMRC